MSEATTNTPSLRRLAARLERLLRDCTAHGLPMPTGDEALGPLGDDLRTRLYMHFGMSDAQLRLLLERAEELFHALEAQEARLWVDRLPARLWQRWAKLHLDLLAALAEEGGEADA